MTVPRPKLVWRTIRHPATGELVKVRVKVYPLGASMQDSATHRAPYMRKRRGK